MVLIPVSRHLNPQGPCQSGLFGGPSLHNPACSALYNTIRTPFAVAALLHALVGQGQWKDPADRTVNIRIESIYACPV